MMLHLLKIHSITASIQEGTGKCTIRDLTEVFVPRVIKIPIQWHVSYSVSYFGLEAASRSCNNRAAEGRTEAAPRAGAGGRVGSKSLLALAAAARKRSIRGLSVLHSYHKLLRAPSTVVASVVRRRVVARA